MTEKEIECPFCKVGKVKTFYRASFMRTEAKSISGVKSSRMRVQPETYEILENCPNCGKTKKEIQRAINTGKTKEMTHEERIEAFRKRGLPLVFGSKT